MKHFLSVVLLVAALAGHATGKPLVPALGMEYDLDAGYTTIFTYREPVTQAIGISYECEFANSNWHHWKRPGFVSITLYQKARAPQWEAIETVTLAYKGEQFQTKPDYCVRTVNGLYKSSKGVKWPATELLTIKVPLVVAREIAGNNGVLISAVPSRFSLAVPASQVVTFAKLISSVEEQPTLDNAQLPRDEDTPTGMPLREIAGKGKRLIATQSIELADRVTVSASVLTFRNGVRVKSPSVIMTFSSYTNAPKWQGQTSAVLNFAGRRLVVKGKKSTDYLDLGIVSELLSIEIPLSDFESLVSSGTFYVTIGKVTFIAPKEKTAGMRALVSKI